MVATAKSFMTAFGIDALVGFICFVAFCILRTLGTFKRFYAPKRYLTPDQQPTRPRRLGTNPFSWIGPTIAYSEEEVLQVAGWDAVVYLRLLRFGMGVFAFLFLWTFIVVLPTNIAGGNYVNDLTNHPPPSSNFTYWISPPPPPLAPGEKAQAPGAEPKVPNFYSSVPPAPEGLIWWQYAPGVPLLPSVASRLGAAFSRYQWRYDPNYQSSSFQFTDLDRASMANIPPKSGLVAVHMISAWVMTIFVLCWLWRYAKRSVALRIRYLITSPKGADSNTVLVQDIPGVGFGTQAERAKSFAPKPIANKIEMGIQKSTAAALKAADTAGQRANAVAGSGKAGGKVNPLFEHSEKGSASADSADTFNAWSTAKTKLQDYTVAQVVEQEFEELFPGQVVAVQPVYDVRDLEPLDKEYDKLSQKLWDLVGDYSRKLRADAKIKKRKQVRVLGATMGAWGREKYGLKPVKMDCLEYWPDRLEYLREQILVKTKEAHGKFVPCAFVTFRTRRAQVVASTTLINHDLSVYLTGPAPSPPTVYWPNIRWRAWERSARTALIWAAFIALCFFYLIPIGAVQAIVNVKLLSKYPPFKQLLKIQFTNAIIVSILPGLVLKIFLALLPMLLTFMNKKAGLQSLSQIDYGVFTKYFIFQVFTVFFGSFVVGSFFSQFNQWINNPTSAVNLIGTAVPQTASFFLTYVTLSALWTSPFSGLKLIGMIIYWIKSKIAATEKARARLWQEQRAKYGSDLAEHTIIILLGLVYCNIQPVITAVALIYFFVNYSIAKYQAIYVLRPAYESGGMIWPRVHNQIMFCLILAQLVLVFILAIKKVIWAPIIVAITIPLSLITHLAILKRFNPPQQTLSYRGATDADNMDELKQQKGEGPSEGDDMAGDKYVSPVFSFSEEEHRELLDAACNVDAVLRGEADHDALLPELPDELDEDELGGGGGNGGVKKKMSLPLFKRRNKGGSAKERATEEETLRETFTGASSTEGSLPPAGELGHTDGAGNGAQPPPQAAASYAPGSPEGSAAVQGAVAVNREAHQ